jgi:hypothetical protein
MRWFKVIRVLAALITSLALNGRESFAQTAAVSGQVLDNTGGALPGVTVQVSSPALIEGTRLTVTDGQGRYSIVALEPGIYSIRFTLTGFSTFVQEGLELRSDFTAAVNASMRVGSLEETVTVSGESPIVDVQRTDRTQLLSRDMMDTLPTGRLMYVNASMMAGVTMSGSDVGGSTYVADLVLEGHGASSLHTTYIVDGLKTDTIMNDGRDKLYFQDHSNLEVSVQTSGAGADVSSGGVRFNMIPKDGGNRFSGSAFIGGTNGSWQSDNFSQELENAGLEVGNKIAKVYDYNIQQGGPILPDRLWFFTSARHWGVDEFVADSFLDDGTQYRSEGRLTSVVARLTYQLSSANKFAFHLERISKGSGPVFTPTYPLVLPRTGDDPETGLTWQQGQSPYYLGQVKWTSTLTSRTLIEAGYSTTANLQNYYPMNGILADRGTPEWYSRIEKRDLNFSTRWNARSPTRGNPVRRVLSLAASYVTGTHNIKVGVQDSWGYYEQFFNSNGDISFVQYRSGVPDSVTVRNTPVNQIARLKYDVGAYAQDSWTLRRMTLHGGVRFEWLNSYVDEQSADAGRFVGARSFAKLPNVPNWFDVSPRMGVTYDVFGNARTAVKFSAGRYMVPHTTSFAARFNPMQPITAAIPWNDRDLQGRNLSTNGDDVAQDNELDLTRLPSNFGQRQLERFDPEIQREYNIETGLTVQHALTRRIALNAGWYRRSYYDFTTDDNLERDFQDYVPVQVVSPYNGEVITAYNLRDQSELAKVDTLVTNAGKERSQVYHGFEVAMEARLPGGGRILGSTTAQRTLTMTCDQVDDPNLLRFCDRGNLPAPYQGVSFKRDFKVAAMHQLPGDIQVSGKFTSYPGRLEGDLVRVDEVLPLNWNIARTTRYTEADCAGRPCTAGALVIPGLVQSSLVIPLAPAGTERQLARLNQLDLGVEKTFRMRGVEYHAQLQIFNALNANTVLAERSSNYGTAVFGVPSEILQGRMPRASVEIRW